MGHAGSDPDPVPLNAFGHLGLQERRCHDVDALAEQFRERIAQVEEREDPTIVEINVHHEIDITVGPILTARRGSEDARIASPVRTNERADRTSLRLKRAKTRLRHIGSRCARLAPKYEAATGGSWKVADAPAEFVETLARAIAGFAFTATAFQAIRKLSQNRPEADRMAVTGWLADSRPDSAAIDWWMQQQQGR